MTAAVVEAAPFLSRRVERLVGIERWRLVNPMATRIPSVVVTDKPYLSANRAISSVFLGHVKALVGLFVQRFGGVVHVGYQRNDAE